MFSAARKRSPSQTAVGWSSYSGLPIVLLQARNQLGERMILKLLDSSDFGFEGADVGGVFGADDAEQVAEGRRVPQGIGTEPGSLWNGCAFFNPLAYFCGELVVGQWWL